MSTLIVSTVGTSLLGHFRGYSGDKATPDYREVLDELNRLDSSDHKCGAEINSIENLLERGKVGRKRLEPPYTLVFLVSDTEDGAWTGKLLKAYNESGKREAEIERAEVATIEGLQQSDPDRFAKQGLRNLVKVTCRYLSEHPDKIRVINATGGYKAQISFAGLIGQTVGVPVVYKFETFPYIIEMPPMPVDFNRDLWLKHYNLFKKLGEEGLVEEGDPVVRDWDENIIALLDHEEVDGRKVYALSPILQLMHEGFLVRWRTREKKPTASAKTAEKKYRVTRVEHHKCRGAEALMRRLCRLDWVDRVWTISLANSAQSRVMTGAREEEGELKCQFSDGEKAVIIGIATTSTSEGEYYWCERELAEVLSS